MRALESPIAGLGLRLAANCKFTGNDLPLMRVGIKFETNAIAVAWTVYLRNSSGEQPRVEDRI